MNFKDSGCKDFEVNLGQQVLISNKARKENGQQGKIIEIDKASPDFHIGNISVQFANHKSWFCTCELK